ncbi:MAG: hypothetical protein ACRC92_20170 [Peptostreptococcaceae bacterium]
MSNNIMWFYLDKNHLTQHGDICVIYKSRDRKLDFETVFEGNALEYKCLDGDNIPPYLYYNETEAKVMEKTITDLVNDGVIVLNPGEYITKEGSIGYYNFYYNKIVDGEVVALTREELVQTGVITLDSELAKIRAERVKVFAAIDKCATAHLMGDRVLTSEELVVRAAYKEKWLNITNDYVDPTEDIMLRVPPMPDFIAYYY